MPAAQGLQIVLNAAPAVVLKYPAAQGMQVEEEEAPVVLLNVPAGHSVAVMEERGQKEPAGQRMGAPEKQ